MPEPEPIPAPISFSEAFAAMERGEEPGSQQTASIEEVIPAADGDGPGEEPPPAADATPEPKADAPAPAAEPAPPQTDYKALYEQERAARQRVQEIADREFDRAERERQARLAEKQPKKEALPTPEELRAKIEALEDERDAALAQNDAERAAEIRREMRQLSGQREAALDARREANRLTPEERRVLQSAAARDRQDGLNQWADGKIHEVASIFHQFGQTESAKAVAEIPRAEFLAVAGRLYQDHQEGKANFASYDDLARTAVAQIIKSRPKAAATTPPPPPAAPKNPLPAASPKPDQPTGRKQAAAEPTDDTFSLDAAFRQMGL